MIKYLVYNEFQKVKSRKRTYISFILISILVPFIVGAIDSGGGTLEKKNIRSALRLVFFHWFFNKWLFSNIYNYSSIDNSYAVFINNCGS